MFQSGDFLVFQLESGYGLLRLLAIEDNSSETVWHIAAFENLFPDIESAESAIAHHDSLSVAIEHTALTQRAFESTQVARLGNIPLTEDELEPLNVWKKTPDKKISDRSIRLMLGLR